MNQVVTILRTARELLADPRDWLKGVWRGVREDGQVIAVSALVPAACFCLGGAISEAINRLPTPVGPVTWTELRSDAERALLETLAIDGVSVPAMYLWNDSRERSHRDVIELIDKTIQRLAPAAARSEEP